MSQKKNEFEQHIFDVTHNRLQCLIFRLFKSILGLNVIKPVNIAM